MNTASLANGAQVSILDEAIDHPGSGEDFGPGALIGLRLHVTVEPAVDIVLPPMAVVLVIPQGLAVPTVSSLATLKQNEKYVWGLGPMVALTVGASQICRWEFNPRTVRRMEPGDRAIVIVVNNTGTAFAATAEEAVTAQVYVREA